jgi:hypothetical protein
VTSTGVRDLNQQLFEAAERLVREYDDLAAGSVLRSYARAVQRRTRTGCPPERLAESSERLAREQLDRRRLAREGRFLTGAA